MNGVRLSGVKHMNSRLEKVINHPLHKQLGISCIESREGCGHFSIRVSESSLNPAGALHGGVIYLLCDVCAYAGLLSLIDEQTEAVTHDIQVSVMRSAKLGDKVHFDSNVVRLGKRICFIEIVATIGNNVIATAKVTKSMISA